MAEWWSAWGAWWQEMTIELPIFYLIGIASTLVLLAQILLMLFLGGDGDISGGMFRIPARRETRRTPAISIWCRCVPSSPF